MDLNLGSSLNPGNIEKKSFAIIESEVPEPRPFQGEEWQVVRRMIHTTADFELLSMVKFHPNAIKSGVGALKSGCLVITDTEMACMGIPMRRMQPLGCRVKCYINDPDVIENAQREKSTRASAAVDHVLSRLNGGIYVVGNAPTALLRLLKRLKEGKCNPALIIGMPVGFVNAAESKEMLIGQAGIPYITIKGRKGGSAIAACVINQMAEIALEKKQAVEGGQ
ncbi:MAG: precorrin-8X methylmutase [Deltaproteobacteria bacterium]|nr:precorrin-8X methylmutase [Deltaproteobacteria bacterium]